MRFDSSGAGRVLWPPVVHVGGGDGETESAAQPSHLSHVAVRKKDSLSVGLNHASRLLMLFAEGCGQVQFAWRLLTWSWGQAREASRL